MSTFLFVKPYIIPLMNHSKDTKVRRVVSTKITQDEFVRLELVGPYLQRRGTSRLGL